MTRMDEWLNKEQLPPYMHGCKTSTSVMSNLMDATQEESRKMSNNTKPDEISIQIDDPDDLMITMKPKTDNYTAAGDDVTTELRGMMKTMLQIVQRPRQAN